MTQPDLSQPIRVALIGYGLAGAVFHAPLIAATSSLALTSVVTSDARRQARARREHPEISVLPYVDALWERSSDHELVVVATPNRFHAQLARASLEHGLPVVIDKPMAPSAEEGRSLITAAEEHGLLLTVFQNRRWDGDFLTVRRLLAEGALGRIVRFESRFDRWRPAVRADAWRERGDPADAGGLLFDLGSHLIDQAVLLFGRPSRIYAEVDRRRPGAEIDDDVFVALTHDHGIRSHLWMSVLAASPGPRMRLLGSRAAYEKHGLDVQEERLGSGMRPSDPGWGSEAPELWGHLSTGDEERAIETEPGAYPEFYAGVVRSLRTGEPPPVDPRESVAVLEIIEAAFRSARDESVVETR
jgi:scyllo-inositol 2-dehydrogenase (NADP+)